MHADERVLVDFRTHDDAGVYVWEGGPALVQTVDFFTPIVDDPYVYGQIAAANAVSDVYAMGGRPLTALAIAGFPEGVLGADVIGKIFAGGHATLREAGVALLGGHTVRDREVKFGYAVTGAIDPARVLTNAGARPGDVLVLTKPIGTGVIGTAIKFERVEPAVVDEAIGWMTMLNKAAAEAVANIDGVHACTDITGFGLIGHSTEIARASGATLVIRAVDVPLLSGAREIAGRNRSGGLVSNRDHFGRDVLFDQNTPDDLRDLLFDPQTSGGLLMSIDRDKLQEVEGALLQKGVRFWRIGEVRSRGEHLIEVV